jgi:hypothetical protein
MAKKKSSKKKTVRRRSSAEGTLKPNKWTAGIVIVGMALSLGLYFLVVTPANKALSTAESSLESAQSGLDGINAQLSEYENGQVLAGEQLADRVAAAEDWLPTLDSTDSPSRAALELTDSAKALGLLVPESSFKGEYLEEGEVKSAEVTMSVSGSQDQLAQWFAELYATAPLKTVKASSVSVSQGQVAVDLTVTLWGTSQESWENGRPGLRPQGTDPSGLAGVVGPGAPAGSPGSGFSGSPGNGG